jgi:hypothetical protein
MHELVKCFILTCLLHIQWKRGEFTTQQYTEYVHIVCLRVSANLANKHRYVATSCDSKLVVPKTNREINTRSMLAWAYVRRARRLVFSEKHVVV